LSRCSLRAHRSTADSSAQADALACVRNSRIGYCSCPRRFGKLEHRIQLLQRYGASSVKFLYITNLCSPQTILRIILRLLQRRSTFADAEVSLIVWFGLILPLVTRGCYQTVSQIQARFIPYFRISHPTRGYIAGPFTKLPHPPVRKLALDVASSLCMSSYDGALDSVVKEAVNEQERQYWMSVRAMQSS
jgi:hypothetical protein